MNILLIEDYEPCRELLRKGLSLDGFTVDACSNGTEGLEEALQRDYALIILDVMLPGQSGWQILGELRKYNKSVPVLMLTGCASVSDRVKGLSMGADGYLPKPFQWEELRARVRALLRRRQGESAVIRIADLEIDTALMKAVRGGQRLDLAVMEFRLLRALASHRGEVLTREYLLEKVWGLSAQTQTNAIRVAVGRLRRKLDDPFSVKLAHVVRGKGYKLEDGSEGAAPNAPGSPPIGPPVPR